MSHGIEVARIPGLGENVRWNGINVERVKKIKKVMATISF
jgi:hypothetical protein